MQIKLFGKSLFEIKKKTGEQIFSEAQLSLKKSESKFLPDFQPFNAGGRRNDILSEYIIMESPTSGGAVAVPVGKKGKKGAKTKAAKPRVEYKITPKGVFEMKMLNDLTFKMNTDDAYVTQQLSDFQDKLGLIKAEEYDMRRGVDEIASIIIRLENRKKYAEFKEFFEQFPYTVGSKIDDVIAHHDHLKIGQIAQFLADMPKEATEVMKSYNEHCKKLCDKQAVFYIIADKKDFERSNKRRDPILLAQSPFGHVWQILGAWDEEMMFLEEL